MNIIGKSVIATTLAATALVSTTAPVMARDYYRNRGGDNTAAVAIGAGVIGLALGAIVASSNNNDRRYQNDGRYYRDDRYYSRPNNRWQQRGDVYDRGRYDDRSRYDDRYYSRRGY